MFLYVVAAAEFVPSTKLKGVDDFTFDSEYFASYIRSHEDGFSLDEAMKSEEDAAEIKFLKEPLTTLMIPKLLRPYTFENGSAMMFPPSGRHSATSTQFIHLKTFVQLLICNCIKTYIRDFHLNQIFESTFVSMERRYSQS